MSIKLTEEAAIAHLVGKVRIDQSRKILVPIKEVKFTPDDREAVDYLREWSKYLLRSSFI